MADTISSDSVAQDQLRAFIERIERMEEEKKAISDDIKEIYAEAKGNGFDTKVLRKIVAIRKMDHAERMEQEALIELYMDALGMQPALPFDDDDEPPRGRPVYRADAVGLRPIASVMGPIVANTKVNTNPGNDAGSAAAPTGNATAAAPIAQPTPSGEPQAEEATPPASSVPNSVRLIIADQASADEGEGIVATALPDEIQPVDHYALDTADLDPARVLLANCIECRARIYEGDDHHVVGPNEEFFCSACGDRAHLPTNHPGGDHANSGGKAVASHASGNSPSGDAAEGTGVVHRPLVPTTDYVVFFDADADARCRKPEMCGSHSRLAVCGACQAAWDAEHQFAEAAE